MWENGFSTHSPDDEPEQPEEEGVPDIVVEGLDLSVEEGAALYFTLTDDTNILLQMHLRQIFTLYYCLSYVANHPKLDGMMKVEIEDGLEYIQYVLMDSHPALYPVLQKMRQAWADDAGETEGT